MRIILAVNINMTIEQVRRCLLNVTITQMAHADHTHMGIFGLNARMKFDPTTVSLLAQLEERVEFADPTDPGAERMLFDLSNADALAEIGMNFARDCNIVCANLREDAAALMDIDYGDSGPLNAVDVANMVADGLRARGWPIESIGDGMMHLGAITIELGE